MQSPAHAPSNSRVNNLSVVVLTLNEELRIGRCVSSLHFAHKLIIIDSFSTDQTRERAFEAWRALGRDPSDLLFVTKTWQGFTNARNGSLKWIFSKWVLWVDADEWVSPELETELRQLCAEGSLTSNEKNADVYRMPRQSYFLGRAIRHGGWFPDRKARLGRAGYCVWRAGPNQSDVHEDLWPTETTSRRALLEGHLGHEPFLNRAEQRATNQRYSTLLAQGQAQRLRAEAKRPPAQVLIIVKVAVKFFENYFFKLGFLDAYPGFIIALGSAQSLYWRLKKLRALMTSGPC